MELLARFLHSLIDKEHKQRDVRNRQLVKEAVLLFFGMLVESDETAELLVAKAVMRKVRAEEHCLARTMLHLCRMGVVSPKADRIDDFLEHEVGVAL